VTLREVGPGTGTPRPKAARPILLDGQSVEARVYARDVLGRGDALRGPAIVEQEDTTTLLPPGFAGTVDRHGNLWIRRDG
jgi:N-methylhydantoinase A